MEWFVDGLEEPVASDTAANATLVTLALNLDDDGLDGTMFTRKATFSNQVVLEKRITLRVAEIQNVVNLSPAVNAIAGSPYTLLCTVASARPSELSWIDPNGVKIPLDSQNVTVSRGNWRNGFSTIQLTFNAVRTSQSGIYKCISSITAPASKKEASVLFKVEIPAPSVIIEKDPDVDQLYTTDSIVLTCRIELIPEVDSIVTINSQWSGHSSLTDQERRVIVSELKGLQLTYYTTVTFTSLQYSDSGSYLCSARVSPLSENVLESRLVIAKATISVVLKVEMNVYYTPPTDFNFPSPPYYRPATSVTISCTTTEAIGQVRYKWSSTAINSFANISSSTNRISTNILKSSDAGIHTCTLYDGAGNTGNQSTTIKLIGSGLYVSSSRDISNSAVTNNDYIVKGSSSYNNVNVSCYSNSTSSPGYYIFPSYSTHSSGNRYGYTVNSLSPGGVQLTNYGSRTPNIWGIFTCVIPSNAGYTNQMNIGIYSQTPEPPSVYSISYSDSRWNYGDQRGTVDCLTQHSPPTTVTWTRDGASINLDGQGYEMIQTVTERRSYFRYRNRLIIKDALDLIGEHMYCCFASNRASSSPSSRCATTTWRVEPSVSITSSQEPIHSEPLSLTCRASLPSVVASRLLNYLFINWMKVDEANSSNHLPVGQDDEIILADQKTLSSSVTQDMIFDPLNLTHRGDYVCMATIIVPNLEETFNTTRQYHLNVLEITLIQLKFGPVTHCSMWFENWNIAQRFERSIKEYLSSLISKNCSCHYDTSSHFDQSEFSCRSVESGLD